MYTDSLILQIISSIIKAFLHSAPIGTIEILAYVSAEQCSSDRAPVPLQAAVHCMVVGRSSIRLR